MFGGVDEGWLTAKLIRNILRAALSAAGPFELLVVAIWEAWCFHFDTLGTISAPWAHPGGPWEKQEGHEGIRNRIFTDFGVIFGLYFECFFCTEA